MFVWPLRALVQDDLLVDEQMPRLCLFCTDQSKLALLLKLFADWGRKKMLQRQVSESFALDYANDVYLTVEGLTGPLHQNFLSFLRTAGLGQFSRQYAIDAKVSYVLRAARDSGEVWTFHLALFRVSRSDFE